MCYILRKKKTTKEIRDQNFKKKKSKSHFLHNRIIKQCHYIIIIGPSKKKNVFGENPQTNLPTYLKKSLKISLLSSQKRKKNSHILYIRKKRDTQ